MSQEGVLIAGPFAGVLVTIIPGERSYSQDVCVATNNAWSLRVADKPHLFDGNVWSLVDWKVKDDTLELCIQRSTYKFLLQTHFTPAGRAMEPEARTNPLGVSAITEACDGGVLVGLRSEKLATCPCMWHLVPAGNVDCEDIQAVLVKEGIEEVGVNFSSEALNPMPILGVLDTGEEQGHKPEVLYHAKLSLTRSELISRYSVKAQEEHDEHDEVRFIHSYDEFILLGASTVACKNAMQLFFNLACTNG